MRKAFPILGSVLLFVIFSAQAGERIMSLEALAESTAFLATDQRLLVTEDAGRQWREALVAPRASRILTASFQDPATAWLLLSRGDDLEVWRTRDGGRRWSASMLPGPFEEGATNGSFSFTDRVHGYLMVRLPSSSNWSRGRLFRTVDAGSHWTALPDPPVAGNIRFLSPERGWLSGGPAGTDLFETRDGAASWNRASVPEAEDPAGDVPVRLHYELPAFSDAMHGLLAVTREMPDSASLLTYVTEDQGVSWKLNGATNFRMTGVHAVAASGKRIITEDVAVDEFPVRDAAKGLPAGFDLSQLSMSNGTGIAVAIRSQCAAFKTNCSSETRVFTTTDDAVTFQDVTPDSLRDAPGVSTQSVTQPDREGFDKACYPSTSTMQTWWSNSSLWYVGAYIGGTHAYCVNHAADCPCPPSSWFSTTSSQGWTFLPIWVGVQEKYGTLNLSSTTTAYNQGVSEGNAAADRMSTLGFPQGNIVYFDFERPHPSNTQPYVQAFVNGWGSQLHARGYSAGIYGSYLSAAAWGNGSVTSPPDAIWPYNLNSPYHTVFGLCGPNYCLPDNIWSNHQRIRQYSQNASESHGGIALTIDNDYADGPAASYSSGSTTHPTVTLTTRQVSPTSVQVNQSFTISTTLQVSAATAEHAGISISFPSLTSPGASGNSYNSSQGTVQTSSISSGAAQLYLDDYPSHLLAEADWSNVGSGASKNFNLTVTPKISGTFTVRIRAWVTTNVYANAWRDPSSGPLDQQGYWVYEHQVTVSAVDGTSPTVTITSPTSNSTHNTSTSPITVGGSASDNVGVTQVTCFNAATGNTVTASGTTSWNCNVSLLSGSNVITVTARDAANNSATDTITVTYTPPDSTPPTVTITSPTSNSTHNTSTSPITMGGSASDNTGVTQVTCFNAATGNTVTASGTTSWNCNVSLLSGSNVITVTARDAASNQATDTITVTYSSGGSGGLSLYVVSPCRILDTRTNVPYQSGAQYGVQIAGKCNIPLSAVAVVANITAVTPSNQGFLTIWAWNLAKPSTSNISFRLNRTRANNNILMLATDGFGDVRIEPTVDNNGTVHVLIDVSGYFQ